MTEKQRSGPELSLSKVAATGLAAATAAILGSFVSTAGSVVGAAAASVVMTVSSALYQRTMLRTRDTVRAHVTARQRALPSRPPIEPLTPSETPPAGSPSHRRRWAFVAGGTVLAFIFGVAAAYGVEKVHGAPLSGGSEGTSLGSLFGEPTGPPRPTSAPPATPTSTAPSSTPSATPTTSTGPSTSTTTGRTTAGPTSSPGSPGAPGGLLPLPTFPPAPTGRAR